MCNWWNFKRKINLNWFKTCRIFCDIFHFVFQGRPLHWGHRAWENGSVQCPRRLLEVLRQHLRQMLRGQARSGHVQITTINEKTKFHEAKEFWIVVKSLCNGICQNAATVTERKKILKNFLAKNWPEKLKTCSKELRVKKSRSICSYVLVSVQMGILWNNICIESISINKSGAIQWIW